MKNNLEEEFPGEPVVFDKCPHKLEGVEVALGNKARCSGYPDGDEEKDGRCKVCQYLLFSIKKKTCFTTSLIPLPPCRPRA